MKMSWIAIIALVILALSGQAKADPSGEYVMMENGREGEIFIMKYRDQYLVTIYTLTGKNEGYCDMEALYSKRGLTLVPMNGHGPTVHFRDNDLKVVAEYPEACDPGQTMSGTYDRRIPRVISGQILGENVHQ